MLLTRVPPPTLCLNRTPVDPSPKCGLGGHITGAEGVGETAGQSPGVRPADLCINLGSVAQWNRKVV